MHVVNTLMQSICLLPDRLLSMFHRANKKCALVNGNLASYTALTYSSLIIEPITCIKM